MCIREVNEGVMGGGVLSVLCPKMNQNLDERPWHAVTFVITCIETELGLMVTA